MFMSSASHHSFNLAADLHAKPSLRIKLQLLNSPTAALKPQPKLRPNDACCRSVPSRFQRLMIVSPFPTDFLNMASRGWAMMDNETLHRNLIRPNSYRQHSHRSTAAPCGPQAGFAAAALMVHPYSMYVQERNMDKERTKEKGLRLTTHSRVCLGILSHSPWHLNDPLQTFGRKIPKPQRSCPTQMRALAALTQHL